MPQPRLRDSRRAPNELYLLNEIPDDIIVKIGGYIVYLLYTGRNDISGSDWGDAFADSIRGTHFDSPIGIADVGLNGVGYSMKTVKTKNPFRVRNVRLISGRCSPDFSYGISDPHEDIQRTGNAVLEIWNERVNIAHEQFNPVRTSVLVRSEDMRSFVIFEEDTNRYRVSDYEWRTNRNGNLEGYNINTQQHCFTWQPHGSQFTILTSVPSDAIKFKVRKPSSVISKQVALDDLQFTEDWVQIIR